MGEIVIQRRTKAKYPIREPKEARSECENECQRKVKKKKKKDSFPISLNF